jgi:hypothetical protein
MRKHLINPTAEPLGTREQVWLELERAAVIEVTSEDKDFPVESAFASEDTRGWRAAAPGHQTIRLIFDHPQRLKCVFLVFEEMEIGRTQEFVLRWSSDSGKPLKEIVRQQWRDLRREASRRICSSEYQPAWRLYGEACCQVPLRDGAPAARSEIWCSTM